MELIITAKSCKCRNCSAPRREGRPRYSIDLTPAKHPDQEKTAPRVSAVVVSHNRSALLRRCLDSLESSDSRERLQVIVIDNGSTDGSAQWDAEFPKVQFIRLPKNFGLTKAMNIGWRAADAAYVFFLHDDAAVEPDTIGRLADVLDANPDAAAVCPLLVDTGGRPAPQLGALPPDGNWRPAEPAGAESVPVEYPRGAALMMRVFLIRAIRQIDEHYGQFGGDADLAAQIRKASKKILLVPAARARHEGRAGYSAAERADFLLSRAVYLEKYRGFGAGLKARLAAIFGPLLSFRLAEFRHTAAGQKIDGTQQ
jgi:N-acetylglucosaminyl-diphospho-decaprenol L-rhamnosyltransferase